MTRFTEQNWLRFRLHNKKTTIRVNPLSPGLHKCLGGPRFKPIRLGTIEAYAVKDTKYVMQLTVEDAVNDGFDSLQDLLVELAHRNPKLTTLTQVHIQPVRVVEDLLEVG